MPEELSWQPGEGAGYHTIDINGPGVYFLCEDGPVYDSCYFRLPYEQLGPGTYTWQVTSQSGDPGQYPTPSECSTPGPVWTFTIDPNAESCLSCNLTNLTPITDPDSWLMEEYAQQLFSDGEVPQGTLFYLPDDSLFPNAVEESFSANVGQLQTALLLQGMDSTRSLGYLPYPYQRHLRELHDKGMEIEEAVKNDIDQEYACSELIRAHSHDKGNHHPFLPVNPSSESLHAQRPAQAIDLEGMENLPAEKQRIVDEAAARLGLTRPCKGKKSHFEIGTACANTVAGGARSPMNVLLTDPGGRRVGFDAATGTAVNEIGQDAWYSGPGTQPQEVYITNAPVGTYVMTGVGTGVGEYTLFLNREDEHRAILESVETSGVTDVGLADSLQLTVPKYLAIEIGPKKAMNRNVRGSITVAVLSTETMSAPDDVDTRTLSFGETGDEDSLLSCLPSAIDADNDGRDDLVCRFNLNDTGITENTTQGVLKGNLRDGTPMTGVDWIFGTP